MGSTINFLLGLQAFIKGSLRLNRYLVLKGMSAKIAGVILMLPLPAGLLIAYSAVADGQSLAHTIIECSYLSIIGVMLFAALQAGVAKLSRKEHLLESNDSATEARTQIVSRNRKSRSAHHLIRL